ncbi:MAG: helix-turn-helix transcriptional regulator [Proteobacteria bacterium]|nr:helix-turn-helix transcriptional regulator [Pseudomonadota bacterium]
MTTFRSRAYDAFVDALKSRRDDLKLSQMDLAAKLPKWLGFDHTTVNKIEHRRRNVSFVEARELAKVLKTSITQLDKNARAIQKGLSSAGRPESPIPKRSKRVARKK